MGWKNVIVSKLPLNVMLLNLGTLIDLLLYLIQYNFN